MAPFRAIFENRDSRGRILLVCEHASHHIPPEWDGLGLTAAEQLAHIAWDPGALDLARGLARRLDACLVHAPVSRLVYDLNRAPDQAGAMPAQSEVFTVPGNAAISAEERARRTQAVYVPFHDDLHIEVARRMALGLAPVIVTIHSFTPVYFGAPRAVEFGIIHDADDRMARAILAHAPVGLKAELNAPYSAADGVTHTLRLQANPYRLANAMLEIRNDLIVTPAAAEAMADQLAPCLSAALATITEGAV
ncbi:N-formylglutamate amidohydrolase [Pseudotabrizicola sp. L79]|uniref:N-formylglutamate amidohydrolase n=1 Tax=Pseudotabrizicola sp. L79 TaxID=3118402 RepID=UPI002F958ACC